MPTSARPPGRTPALSPSSWRSSRRRGTSTSACPRAKSRAKPTGIVTATAARPSRNAGSALRRAAHDADEVERLGGRERPCKVCAARVARGVVDDEQAHVLDIGPDGVAEQQHHRDRHQQQHAQRLPVTQDVTGLFEDERAEGRHRRTGAVGSVQRRPALGGHDSQRPRDGSAPQRDAEARITPAPRRDGRV